MSTIRRARRLFAVAFCILGVWLAFGAVMVWKRLYVFPTANAEFFAVAAGVAIEVLAWATATPLAIYAVRALALPQALGRRLLLVGLLLAFAPFAVIVQVALTTGISSTFVQQLALANDRALELVYYNVFPLLGIGAATLCVHARRAIEEQQRDQAELSDEIARVQLQQLRADLEPHFLFNVLNSIAALIEENPPQAEATLRRLSDLLEWSLRWESTQAIPLREEVAFLSRYLDIQAMRFRDRLTTRVDLPSTLEDVLVPPLILQPLVENAVLHGIVKFNAPGRIELRASSFNGKVLLEVRDSGPGFEAGAVHGSGIGISNIRARLRLLYGLRDGLTFHREHDRFVARVVLPDTRNAA